MAKNLSIFNFKLWPKALLLSIALILCIEAANAALDDFTYPPPFDSLRMKVKNKIAQHKGNDYDVLIFGDCYNIHGVDAPLIERETGLKVYNFSTHAAHGIFSSYLMLKNYLRTAAKKPKYIVVSFLPQVAVMTKEQIVSTDLGFLYEFADGNIPELAKEFGTVNAVKWMIPSLKHQEFFKKRFWTFQFPKEKDVKAFIQSVYDDRGTYHIQDMEGYGGEFVYDDRQYRQPISAFFERYIRAIFDLAKQNNIPVVYTLFSAPPDWYTVYARAGMTQRYFEYFQSLEKDYPNVTYYNSEVLLNQMDHYRDSTHLSVQGSIFYSTFLSKIIQNNIAAIPR